MILRFTNKKQITFLFFPGTVKKVKFSRMQLFDIWLSTTGYKTETERVRKVLNTLTQTLPDLQNIDSATLNNRVIRICRKFVSFWKEGRRHRTRVISKHSRWLEVIEEVPATPCSADSRGVFVCKHCGLRSNL